MRSEPEYTFRKMDRRRAHWVVPRIYAPPAAARDVLDVCFVTECNGRPTDDERARRMPEGASYVVFLRGLKTSRGVDESQWALVAGGAQEDVHEIPSWDYRLQCGIRIQPGAAPLVLGRAAADATNKIVPLRELWGDRAEQLAEQLMSASTEVEALSTLVQATGNGAAGATDEQRLPIRLAKAVRDAPGDARLAELAAELGLSVRTLERRFRDNLGLSPKKYQRITRIAKVLDLLHTQQGDWAGIASLAGYYDQSHLIDDCHSILGRSPERFLRTITNAGSLEIGLVFDRPATG